MRFKQLDAVAVTYDERVIQYTYDALSRLTEADYVGGSTYTYGFDLAGNLVNMDGTSRTYNAANQISNGGFSYDNNGNLTDDGTNGYTWDRANRLLSMGGLTYAYDGLGHRVSQDNGVDVTQYLLDVQPGLAVVLSETIGVNTRRYIHTLRGLHARHDGSAWTYPVKDGLGSVRGYINPNNEVLSNINYSEYGVPDTNITGPAFTGEWRDETEIQYHRTRYYKPVQGLWTGLDTLETVNRYSYVTGNPVNYIDPLGLQDCIMSVTGEVICKPPLTLVPLPPITWIPPITKPPINPPTSVPPTPVPTSTSEAPRQPTTGPTQGTTPAVTATPVPTAPAATTAPTGTAAPTQVVTATAAAQLAVQANTGFCPALQGEIPTIQPTATRTSFVYHLAFGLAAFDEGISGAPALEIFTNNLNDKFQVLRRYPTVMFDRMWWNPANFPFGVPALSNTRFFPDSFNQAISDPRVVRMHFNIEGIANLIEAMNEISDLKEFAIYNGNEGETYFRSLTPIEVRGKPVTFLVTAWELHRIASDRNLCAKTDFYEHGTQDVSSPNQTLKSQICNML